MIDDAEKRRAASGVPFLPVGPGVTPEATKDTDWRQQAAWSYSGVGVSGEVVDEETVDYLIRARRRLRR